MKITNKDWWDGELNGKTGIFPSNYVETISDSAKIVKPVNEVSRRNTVAEKPVSDGNSSLTAPIKPKDSEKPKVIPRATIVSKPKETKDTSPRINLVLSNPGINRNTKPNHLAINTEKSKQPKQSATVEYHDIQPNGANGIATQRVVPVTVKTNDLIFGEFEECHTEDGDLFYFNIKTGVSVWELPEQPN